MSYKVFGALLHRELKVVFSSITNRIIDNIIIVLCNVLSYKCFMPLLGMPTELIVPTYIGNIMITLYLLGNTFAMARVFDLKFSKFVNYQISLPLSKKLVFSTYIFAYIIEGVIVAIPLLAIGLFILRDLFSVAQMNIPAIILITLLSLLFNALFFLFMSHNYSFRWFMDNAHARRLSPMFLLSATFFVWSKVASFSPILGYIMLFNPLTLTAEGLRGAILGFDKNFVNFWFCISMLGLYCILATYGLTRGIRKQLDPV